MKLQLLAVCISAISNASPLPPKNKDAMMPLIELHVHLDGSLRYSTILELAQKKNISLQGATTLEELKEKVVSRVPTNLTKVLEAFSVFTPVILDDLEAIERVAYEMCEDAAKSGVIYFEARYAPRLLTTEKSPITSRKVVRAVYNGFKNCKKNYDDIDARQILCMIRTMNDTAMEQETLQLADEMRDYGVVGIDVAGVTEGSDDKYAEGITKVFQNAEAKNIHRTAHAGESGSVQEIKNALTELRAERIGHGYHVMQDLKTYRANFVNDGSHHLEACPTSSIMTAAVPLPWEDHPVKKWAQDDANFSLSRDDPTLFDNTMRTEVIDVAQNKIHLTPRQIWKAQLNAAKASFLDGEEKENLIRRIQDAENRIY